MPSSSARPARLQRFEDLTATMAEAVDIRVDSLEGAIDSYHWSCDPSYRPYLGDLPDAVRSAMDGLASLGRWTGDVGRAFTSADARQSHIDLSPLPDPEHVRVTDDDELVALFDDEWDDPFLGAPAIGFPPGEGDPDQPPPSWLDLATDLAREGGDDAGALEALLKLANGIDELPVEWTVEVVEQRHVVLLLNNGTVVEELTETRLLGRALVPGTAPAGRVAFARWVGRGGTLLGFLAAAGDSWVEDTGSAPTERLARAVARGSGVAAGAWAGGSAGAWAGGACGPAAWVCSPVLGLAGGFLGSVGADWVLDLIPWMRPDDPRPLEHDLDAMHDQFVGAELSVIDELDAWEAAADELVGSVHGPFPSPS